MNRFCHECGVAVSDTNRFCNKCGARLLPTQPASPDGSGQADARQPASFPPPPAPPLDPTLEKTARLPGLPSPAASLPSPPLPQQSGT
ncbi:MAG: zinc ribbon domain-containing protein, partial [Blastocatellia bacterium]